MEEPQSSILTGGKRKRRRRAEPLARKKCHACRLGKVKCLPQPARDWPEKCDQCLARGLDCSPPEAAIRTRKRNRIVLDAPAEPHSLGGADPEEGLPSAIPSEGVSIATEEDPEPQEIAADFQWDFHDLINVVHLWRSLQHESRVSRWNIEAVQELFQDEKKPPDAIKPIDESATTLGKAILAEAKRRLDTTHSSAELTILRRTIAEVQGPLWLAHPLPEPLIGNSEALRQRLASLHSLHLLMEDGDFPSEKQLWARTLSDLIPADDPVVHCPSPHLLSVLEELVALDQAFRSTVRQTTQLFQVHLPSNCFDVSAEVRPSSVYKALFGTLPLDGLSKKLFLFWMGVSHHFHSVGSHRGIDFGSPSRTWSDKMGVEALSLTHTALLRGWDELGIGILDFASLETKDWAGRRPSHYAAAQGTDWFFEQLKQRPTLRQRHLEIDDHGRYPVFYACQNGHASSVDLMLRGSCATIQQVNHADIDGRTALMSAAHRGHLRVISSLLSTPGTYIGGVSNDLDTVLHFAAKSGQEATVRLVAQALVKNGFAFFCNLTNEKGECAVSIAAHHGYEEVAKVLLEELPIDFNERATEFLKQAITSGSLQTVQFFAGCLQNDDTVTENLALEAAAIFAKANNQSAIAMWLSERHRRNSHLTLGHANKQQGPHSGFHHTASPLGLYYQSLGSEPHQDHLLTESTAATPRLKCTECSWSCDSMAELRKHIVRHAVSFKCTEPGCPLADGFATSYDLARHRRSSHPAHRGPRFKCNLGFVRRQKEALAQGG